ncbi:MULTISPECIES: hypothetical protein [Rhizobium]|uniref:Tetrahydrofolate dehydrogenase/cyclohydrolase NAD(P)-binding domain-containing protein n=1 Tax=Rhizobium anhuiense TaxID=1184720 RepID=A0A432NYC4_9HYPH|nr:MULTISPECIES: hypothetical protein [Rhizobium]NKM53458.1 hypothetical protein [Rhizobium anhuiense]PDS38476.1 hypothetical protein CO665_10645 [Rhizobium anhuiense]PDS43000.1 hypothetical protein CO668_20550 [Rhizobium anhuiense]PDS51084.1 hypothetical protein CO662_16565 [Rhizobium anhuiense]PDS59058.1 hypothetical protein CO663_09685 [Rhizobium anhuiense]
MASVYGKRRNGSDCTIVSPFPKISCSRTSTGSRRFQRRDPGACERQAAGSAPASHFPGIAPASRAGAITPVLGGVGPMTIMSMMHNTAIAAFMRRGLEVPQQSGMALPLKAEPL